MPFEKTLRQPELIEAMHAAFIRVCWILRLRPGSSESDIVALSILDLAKTGVHDARTLASLAWSASGRRHCPVLRPEGRMLARDLRYPMEIRPPAHDYGTCRLTRPI
jgi:hypothetical protein